MDAVIELCAAQTILTCGPDPHRPALLHTDSGRVETTPATGMIAQLVTDFRALSPVKQAAIVALSAGSWWLSGSAELSIQRTPAAHLRGPKLLWRLACLTNTVGPVAYFRWGRRP